MRKNVILEQLAQQNIRLATLNAISMTVSSSLDLTEVLDSTIDKMLEIFEPESIRVYLLDKERGVLNLAAHKGISEKFLNKSHMRCRKLGDGLLGQTAVTGNLKVVDNFLRSGDPYVDCFIEEGLQCSVYIPLVSKGKAVGVMSVASHSEYNFSDDYIKFLAAIGNQIGVAIDNANLYESGIKAYDELKKAQEQVIRAEKLASLGKLAATVAHEINNPLAAVLTYIRLMMKLVDRGSFKQDRIKDIAKYLNTMESETSRCGEIVRNLLAFSRQSNASLEKYNIEDIIDKALILIAHELEMNEIEFVRDIESGLPKILCDFKQIQQAFLNLMTNASDAMTKGGTLTVAARRGKDNSVVEIVFSDTGGGISEENLRKLFEPFFTTKEEGKGVGLGLSVVFGIITRHNGYIEVDSQLGKGSQFKVGLPAS